MNLPRANDRDGAYEHQRHAGNPADVYKHAALVALLTRLSPRFVVETHAGAGRYHLGPQGEWQHGIGALLAADLAGAPAAVTRYLELEDARPSKKGLRYLGSPVLTHAACPDARSLLFEVVADTAGHLARAVPEAQVEVSDGLAALRAGVADAPELVLVDPPYASKAEWNDVAAAVLAYARRAPATTVLLWYPVKTLTRPNALLSALAGLPGFVVESAPQQGLLASGKLVGSGLVVVHPPPGFEGELIALAGWLTPRLSRGQWSLRARSIA